MIDVDIKHADGTFKLRVCGIVKRDNKVLTLKSNTLNGYCFPGGHAELGEISSDAVKREMKEELNIEVKVEHLICVTENVYINTKGTTSHEIAYYYLVSPEGNLPENDFILEEMDKGKLKTHHLCWLDINKLNNYNILPSFIVKLLQDDSKDKVVSLNQIKNILHIS